jgi:hypothetical protein
MALAVVLILSAVVQATHGQQAVLVSPEPGSTVTTQTVTFEWTTGAGRYYFNLGTGGPGSRDIFASAILPNSQTSITVEGIPTSEILHAQLWSETEPGSNRFWLVDYQFNNDRDSDGIEDTIDPDPESANALIIRRGGDFVLTVLGSGRVASFESANLFAAAGNSMDYNQAWDLASMLYQKLKDHFDFIIVATDQPQVPTGTYYGRFYNARNDIRGLGKNIFDNTARFGSGGRLQGLIHLTSTAGLKDGPSLHELLHNWAHSMDAIPTEVSGHWGYSNIGGQLGGWEPGSLEELGTNRYKARNPRTGEFGAWGANANGGNSLPYSQFELYLMGLIPADEVGHDIRIARDFEWVDTTTGEFSASSISTVTMDEIIAAHGQRIPDVSQSQKDFSILYLILTDRPLSAAEWARHDRDVYDFSLPADNGSPLYNFWEATGGRAVLTMNHLLSSIREAPAGPFFIEDFFLTDVGSPAANLRLDSETGFHYTLQYSENLKEWNDGETVAGTGERILLQHPLDSKQHLCFRIIRSPIEQP